MTSEQQEQQEQKFCRDCKHLIGNRTYPEDWESWNCGHPKNIEKESNHPVSGQLQRTFKYQILQCAVEPMIACGMNWWEKYNRPIYNLDGRSATLSRKPGITADDL